MMNGYELCGWVGAILVLVAYYMVTTGRASGDSKPFQLINISGAILLIAYTYNCGAYASMIVNIMWVAIGMGSFIKFIKLSNIKLSTIFSLKTKYTLATALFGTLTLLTLNIV
jgi:hypothetical protein